MVTAYSEDFRACVVANYTSGMPRSQVLSVFQIGSDTLTRWVRQHRETGSLAPRTRGRYRSKKLDDKALLDYVEAHNDATLQEIAEHFSVCFQTIWARLKVLGVTRKKNHVVCRARRGETRKIPD